MRMLLYLFCQFPTFINLSRSCCLVIPAIEFIYLMFIKIIKAKLANALELSQKYKLFELGHNIIVYDTVPIEKALYRGFSSTSELLIEPPQSQVVVYHSSSV